MEVRRVIRVALITGLLLLVPFIAMQFTDEVNWTAGDFVVMGTLLLIVGFVFELIVRRVKDKDRRFVAAVVLLLAFLYVWAELAVGIFTNWGS